jgi:hypothetical protein
LLEAGILEDEDSVSEICGIFYSQTYERTWSELMRKKVLLCFAFVLFHFLLIPPSPSFLLPPSPSSLFILLPPSPSFSRLFPPPPSLSPFSAPFLLLVPLFRSTSSFAYPHQLGIERVVEVDEKIFEELFQVMEKTFCDFTNVFRILSELSVVGGNPEYEVNFSF